MIDEKEIRKIFSSKKSQAKGDGMKGFVNADIDKFTDKFRNMPQHCHYCGLKNEQSKLLFDLRPEATRGGRRGRRLEIDRKNPHLKYDELENLVWACYWCNNAKSNFFSEEEFNPVQKGIKKSLQAILEKM